MGLYGPVSYTHLDVYKRQSLSWGNMSGNADIPVGNTVLKTAFQNVVYNQAGLGIGSLESSVIVENKTITVGGKNIIYTKEQGLSFEQLSGNVERCV